MTRPASYAEAVRLPARMRSTADAVSWQGRARCGGPAVLVTGMDISWRARAACRGADTNLFFVERSDPDAIAKRATARSICRGCPVRAECEHAGRREPIGMWGGLTAEERRGVRARAAS